MNGSHFSNREKDCFRVIERNSCLENRQDHRHSSKSRPRPMPHRRPSPWLSCLAFYSLSHTPQPSVALDSYSTWNFRSFLINYLQLRRRRNLLKLLEPQETNNFFYLYHKNKNKKTEFLIPLYTVENHNSHLNSGQCPHWEWGNKESHELYFKLDW